MALKVGIKFCGFCNPDFDAAAFLEQLKSLTPGIEYVRYDDPAAKVYLYLNGCCKDCLSQGEVKEPRLVVGGAKINYQEVPLSELAPRLSRYIKHYEGGDTSVK